MDIQGWVTLTNSTGTTFANARTLLVAGNPGGGGGFRRMTGTMDSRAGPRATTASGSATIISIRSPRARRSPTRSRSR